MSRYFKHCPAVPDLSRPLANEAQEAEAQEYAKSFTCSIEDARRDVLIEWNATDTDVDAFIDRTESTDLETCRGEYRDAEYR
jgi:hypothetical protein